MIHFSLYSTVKILNEKYKKSIKIFILVQPLSKYNLF